MINTIYGAHLCFVPSKLAVFPHEKWCEMIKYFLNACPNLKTLDILIWYKEIGDSINSILLHFEKTGYSNIILTPFLLITYFFIF